MVVAALALVILFVVTGVALWASFRAAGRYDRDCEHDALIDEAALEGDLRDGLADISFGQRGG